MNFKDDIPSTPTDDFKDHFVLVFDLTSMQDAAENCHYHERVAEPLRLELNFPNLLKTSLNSLYWVNKCRRLQLTSLVLLERRCKNWIILLCNKLSIVSLCSSFGISVRFPKTLFQLLIMTLLLLSTRNAAICRVNIGSWLQVSDTNCILQTLLDVKCTVFSTTSTTSSWCQHPYSLTQVYAAFIQYMQLFISSSFDKTKLQEFTMLMCSLL